MTKIISIYISQIFFTYTFLSLSLSLFHSFLPSRSKAIVVRRASFFYLYAIKLYSRVIIFLVASLRHPPPLFPREIPGHHSPSPGKNAKLSFTYISTCVMNWLREYEPSCFLATCICSPFWILPGIFTHLETCRYNFLFFFSLFPANRRPTRSCQEYSRFLG